MSWDWTPPRRDALTAFLRTADAAFDRPLAEGLGYEVEQIQDLFEHGEAAEGIGAFLEKRPPKIA